MAPRDQLELVVAAANTRRPVDFAGRRVAVVVATALAIVLVAVFQGRGGDVKTVAEKLLEVRPRAEQRPASLLLGHYVMNGKVHYFKQTTTPASAYANPAADQTEYRATSTSGLGFAGGGDPYKYIRTGHYAKILAAEKDVEQGWSNGTTYHALGAMKVAQGRMQQLAEAGERSDIKTRDEAILALLSAPVSASELRAGLKGLNKKADGSKVKEKDGLRNLNKYIKESIDSFSAPEQTKLESLSPEQLAQLKTNLIRSAAKAPHEELLEEEGHNVFAEKPKPKPQSVSEMITEEKARAFALENKAAKFSRQQGEGSSSKAKEAVKQKAMALHSHVVEPSAMKNTTPKLLASTTGTPKSLAIANSSEREHAKIARGIPMSARRLSAKAAALQRFSDAFFGHSIADKRKLARGEVSPSDQAARAWTPPAKFKETGLGATSDFQSLLETKPGGLQQKWLKKESEMMTPLAPTKAKKRAEKGGFQDIEAARKRKAVAKKLAREDDAQEATAASVVGKMYQGDQHSRASTIFAPNDNSFWDAKQAEKLSHMSVYTATRQTATKATDGYRSTPAMSDPYRYIRTGNYAKILAQEAQRDKTFTPTP